MTFEVAFVFASALKRERKKVTIVKTKDIQNFFCFRG